jgi:hypothetical protein
MKKLVNLAAAAVVLAGCAENPDNISASYVSPMLYQDYTCSQIADEARRVSARQAQAIGAQREQASEDAVATTVGVILFWPALFFIDGDGDNAAQVARLKGEMEAIEQANIQKRCGIQFRAA